MDETCLNDFDCLMEEDDDEEESYWDDPYGEYIRDIEEEGHSEMYYDFDDDDRPGWLD